MKTKYFMRKLLSYLSQKFLYLAQWSEYDLSDFFENVGLDLAHKSFKMYDESELCSNCKSIKSDHFKEMKASEYSWFCDVCKHAFKHY